MTCRRHRERHPNPIIGLIIAVFVLVFLVIRTRVHRPDRHAGGGLHRRDHRRHEHRQDPHRDHQGFGSTLGSIGIVIGLGVMMGRLLEVSAPPNRSPTASSSGSASAARRALAITGYIVSIPIFVDSAFVILYPVAKALAKAASVPCSPWGGARRRPAVTHHTVPPTPGPLGLPVCLAWTSAPCC